MIPQTTARRAAEEFARVIDGPSPAEVADRYTELTRTVTLLREHPRPVPRPEFVLDLRERLMAAAETDLVPGAEAPAPVRPIRSSPARRRLATVAAAAAFVEGTAGMAAAAQGTVPGDNLYPIKRGLENIQLHLSTSDGARGRDLLAQSGTRLGEAKALLAQPRSAQRDARVSEALDSATSNANKGADLLFTSYQRSRSADDISAVRDFAADQMGVLDTLAAGGGLANGQIGKVGDALAAIDQQARVLCAACSDLPSVVVPSSVLNLSAAKTSLTDLVSVPTVRAKQLEELAKRAQNIAAHSTTTQPTTPESTTPPAPQTTTPSAGASPTSPADQATKPVRDLLKGLTDSSTGLPGQLATTVSGLTSSVTGLVDGTLGAVTGTVQGLLGGDHAGQDQTQK